MYKRFGLIGGLLEKLEEDFVRECQEKDAPFNDLDPTLWKAKV
ncbi:MAG TPA: hypothetical protein VK171_13000 [Fimbriimonas sp.]|nr:hypothetical protein [Fimbriimonas sp.]